LFDILRAPSGSITFFAEVTCGSITFFAVTGVEGTDMTDAEPGIKTVVGMRQATGSGSDSVSDKSESVRLS
jgi:hypothetical protein